EFYFMEMNTRLQVEHPVTEAITGLDLVELQLRVASGEPLGLVQEDIKFSGHAIEIRLCAEDAALDFMPQSGTMARWRAADNIRVDHALRSGAEISPFYDSMIAKLIAFGSTREEARSRLICGLEQTVAFGVTTNQSFLWAGLRHPGLRGARRPPALSAFSVTNSSPVISARKLRWRAWLRMRRLPRCCSPSPIPPRGPGGAAGRWRLRFRFRYGSRSMGQCMSWNCCAIAKAAIASITPGTSMALCSRS